MIVEAGWWNTPMRDLPVWQFALVFVGLLAAIAAIGFGWAAVTNWLSRLLKKKE